jgi:hypothetical protein
LTRQAAATARTRRLALQLIGCLAEASSSVVRILSGRPARRLEEALDCLVAQRRLNAGRAGRWGGL